ncbi:MAG: hypothetical protein R6V75_10975, partial [Bacteroidales bacterium]
MTLSDLIRQIPLICIGGNPHPALETTAALLSRQADGCRVTRDSADIIDNKAFFLEVSDKLDGAGWSDLPSSFIFLKFNSNGGGRLAVSHLHLLYGFVEFLLSDQLEQEALPYLEGRLYEPAFQSHRVAYDYFLTQEGRITRGLDRESYLRELARNGFSHVEVNGLASPMGIETGPKGEVYPMFYTYCPALDQFVYSSLNKGIYPYYYLSANLTYLKENARLARRYGLVPGLLCFEPRAVPEEFFNKYPMLRGARVDHPFRSFRPRYNMTITHPKVLDHYAEMVQKLMKEVPELGFLNIWTNDSGAGFEHTKSLYVGRNGGAYLVREWKDDAEIARLAGENALRFFRVLKQAGEAINPGFRVITRMESFYGEHDIIINGLDGKLDIETASLIQRGWEMPYQHPLYPDRKDINAGCVFQQGFDERERPIVEGIRETGSQVSFYFAYGPQTMFAPLMGIPYPGLTHQRLETLRSGGIDRLAHMGGTFQPDKVPFNINHEVLRNFQFNSQQPLDMVLNRYVARHAPGEPGHILLQAWKETETGILGFPNVSSLYSTIGFTWYRLWTRPLVPDIERVPQMERNYYEDFMCTIPHNPNNVDLGKDVLFTLTTPDRAGEDALRIDRNSLPHLEEAIRLLDSVTSPPAIIIDQLVRIRALRCWITTQRNIAVWVQCVNGFMKADNQSDKQINKCTLQEMIRLEIANSREIISLLETGVEFIALTDQGETPLMYGTNLPELLLRRIELMEA